MLKPVTKLLLDESGASVAEYALILAIVGATITAAGVYLSGQISDAMNGTGNMLCDGVEGGDSICAA